MTPAAGKGQGRRGRTMPLCGACLLLAVLAAGCGRESESYFPLDEGWLWEYRITVQRHDVEKSRIRSVVANLAPIELEGGRITPRITENGDVYYYQTGATGIRRAGVRKNGAAEVSWHKKDRFVLKFPLQKGTSWRVSSTTYFSVWTIPTRQNHRIRAPLTLEYVIEATDDEVSVPAGDFRNCVRIRGVGKTSYKIDDRIGVVNIEVESVEWFAPGAGLVKAMRTEQSPTAVLGRNRSLTELAALAKGS